MVRLQSPDGRCDMPSTNDTKILAFLRKLQQQVDQIRNSGGAVQGTKGLQGDPGSKGPIGDKGATGDKGSVGDKGVQGDKGLTGDTGAKGSVGDKGPVGDQGVKGVQGDKGIIGDTGLKGATGDKGAVGDQGAKGLQGDKGLTGDKGMTGDKGATGDKGPTGSPPYASTLQCANDGTLTVTFPTGRFNAPPIVEANAVNPGDNYTYNVELIGNPTATTATLRVRRFPMGAITVLIGQVTISEAPGKAITVHVSACPAAT